MPKYHYLIIGGGMTADAAVQGIRQVDSSNSIGVLSDESKPPYNRPPLSKGLWKGMKEKFIWRDTESKEVSLHLSTLVTDLDAEQHEVRCTDGNVFEYKTLLLATGGAPRQLPNAPKDIIYFRNYQDYTTLRSLAESKQHFTVVGGGFIGSEIAAALVEMDKDVTMIFPESGICGRIFPESISDYLTNYYQNNDIEIRAGGLVSAIEKTDNRYHITLKNGNETETDAVVAGLGILPNTELAVPDIYAAGDVANFYNPALDKRIRVEHEDNANTQGLIAGRNMAGEKESYDHLPYFYSDLFDLSYQAMGILDPGMHVVEDWKEKGRKGVLYYLDNGKVRGVALWGIWRQLDNARELIANAQQYSEKEIVGTLPA